jgi:hypothetical protein
MIQIYTAFETSNPINIKNNLLSFGLEFFEKKLINYYNPKLSAI